MTLRIRIDRASSKWAKAFPRMNAKMEAAASRAFLKAKKPAAFKRRAFETTVILTDDANVKILNRDYRGKNKPTNVLSFPQFDFPSPQLMAGRESVALGDVVMAFETIRREAKAQKKTLESHALHLVVHGILHLLGYDHMREKDAKTMEKLECDILRGLGYDNPYHAPKAETGGVR